MVWDHGGLVKTRAYSLRIIVDLASLPGPPVFLDCAWCDIPSTPITQEDVAAWPYSVNILLEFTSFLASLHWPHGGADLGVGGVSFVEMLILCERWAGERLVLEEAHPRYLRLGRPISVSAVPF